jgi:peroxiredoxin
MGHRTKDRQEVHDKKVAETARGLKKRGYNVQADLPGHKKPTRIGSHIPDVIAKKGDKVIVREVETPSTVSQDKAQHKAFENWAKKQGAEFRVLIAKKKK